MPTRYSRNDIKSHPQTVERLHDLNVRSCYTVNMPKNKLIRRYGSGGQLYASIGDEEKRTSFVVENDIYETPEEVLNRKLSVCYETIADVVENDQYHTIANRRRSLSESNSTSKDYDCYSISPSKDSDHNKNTITAENNSVVNLTEEAIYEEIDKIREKLGFPEETVENKSTKSTLLR